MLSYRLFFSLVLILVGLTFTGVTESTKPAVASFQLEFFAQPIHLDYAPDMRVEWVGGQLQEASLDRAYRVVRSRNGQVLLASLLAAKERYHLNDFLFFQLARRGVGVIFRGGQRVMQEITLFHLLNEAGFDARLTYKSGRAYVNVFTDEELFEVPIIGDRGRNYANISCLQGNCDGRQRLYIYQHQPNPTGRSFGFQLPDWPTLKSQPRVRPMRFRYRGRERTLEVTFDQTMVDIMKEYPFIHEYAYLETPLSPTLRNSLLPALRKQMSGLDRRGQLELLVSFTRSAFAYKEDNDYFGRSKPMVPEELFGYAYSDCEDRSALFYALVRDLMDAGMAVIAYDDHLTIAVESADIEGDFFHHEGRRYIFCDPTGPRGSSRIGQIPPGYEGKSFSVIGVYN